MFDVSQHIDILLPSPAGAKTVTVRFPSDTELIDRMSRQKTVVRPIGRGKTVSETLNADEINLALVQKILEDGSAAVDEFEATHIVNELIRCEVVDSERSSTAFTITVSVPGAETTHTLRMPTMKQVMQYRRHIVSSVEGRRGGQEIRFNLQVAGDLYDQLVEKTDGYQGDVPVVHKSAVVSEALALLDEMKDTSDTKGF